MKAMNFYTANGWAGSNYDSKLSTKEISAKVRSYAKKNFPVNIYSKQTGVMMVLRNSLKKIVSASFLLFP